MLHNIHAYIDTRHALKCKSLSIVDRSRIHVVDWPCSQHIFMRMGESSSRYWKTNISYLIILLSIWFVVSFGCGILFVEVLNEYKIYGFPLGFWFAQQGSILTFVILIFVYVVLMNRLDKKYGVAED